MAGWRDVVLVNPNSPVVHDGPTVASCREVAGVVERAYLPTPQQATRDALCDARQPGEPVRPW